MKKRSKKWVVWTVVLLVVILAGFVSLSGNSTEDENNRKTVKVNRQDIVDKALAVGSIEPVNEIEVKAKVSGVVGKLFADVGDFVKAGEPLLEVKPDPTPLELAQAKRDVEMATIELETLAKELKRNKQLKTKGLISDHKFEALTQQYDEAKLRHQISKERLDLIEKGKVKIANTNIETVVKAPMTGFILEKNVNLGDPVVPLTSYQPGTPLMRMADMDDLIFKGTVDEIDVGKIKEGMTCELQVGALPGETITGHVTLISLKAKKEDNTTVFPVEIKIDETNDAVLRAGYSANAHIIIAKRDSVLAIPERVVTFRNDSAFVKIPVGENGSEERYIKTGLSDAILIEVVEGLKEGEEVLEKEVKEIT
ncbi:efflux RND transporter periplasmic adaptor subunit [candidate division KSB1 bacterium]|nr:efflux RND transporter periplasmic adaptor subunit [candidate division KSB1 bacterium]NIS27988.1 efflux RND transporter periplasmic adaptor subunit [candidate division KSB1 bacterium]NIT74866.1 efflux RND transporter periplasmic adaptor subunit [candidate division KSB1 bacterium]NIU28644.1 efflux RND transporter periplasmic adaptor subunit [candidate division KSB1 bacterium]NIU92957.1 efflux RND transporter periplasmic adaptor subunit [candidate division KSB1 bacterium]